jgi:hypothetical protein
MLSCPNIHFEKTGRPISPAVTLRSYVWCDRGDGDEEASRAPLGGPAKPIIRRAAYRAALVRRASLHVPSHAQRQLAAPLRKEDGLAVPGATGRTLTRRTHAATLSTVTGAFWSLRRASLNENPCGRFAPTSATGAQVCGPLASSGHPRQTVIVNESNQRRCVQTGVD